MAYKIAVASSDGQQVDLHFGGAKVFTIYEVDEDGYREVEKREVPKEEQETQQAGCQSGCASGCGQGNGSGHGCGGGETSKTVELLSDCRCIVCLKIGHKILKQLERKAITAFDVGCSVEEALQKITAYYKKVDTHQSLRKARYENS